MRSARSSRSTPWCKPGAEAIVVFPISPTALNQVVKNACDKGVLVFAYDARDHRALRLQHLDRPGGGRPRHGRMAGRRSSAARATSSLITGVPGTSVDTLRTKAAKEVFAKHPDIKIVAEAVGMWSQAVARTELSKILATHSWDEIDGLWMQVGCYTANSMQLEAGKTPERASALRRRRLEWRPHPDAAGRHRGRRRQRHLRADGRAAHLLRLAALFRRAGAEARGRRSSRARTCRS